MPAVRRTAALWIVLALGFLLLGAAVVRPLLPHLTEGMPYTHYPAPGHELVRRAQGDGLQFYYHLWLIREMALGRVPPFSDPYEFAVPGEPARIWALFLPLSPLFVLLAPPGGLLAYNLLVLASFALAGTATAAWARLLGLGWLPALAAGVVFTLFPYRLAVLLGGQPTGFGAFLLPAAMALVEGALLRRSLGLGVAAGVVILWIPTTDPHLLYVLGILLPVYSLVRLPAWLDRLPGDSPALGARLRRLAPLISVALAVLLAAGYMLYVKRTALDPSVVGAGRTLDEIRLFAPALGDLFRRDQPQAAHAVYPGVVALVLGAMGLWRSRRSPLAWGLAALFLGAAILSLGPSLPVYEWFYRYAPYGGFIRQTAKFQLLAAPALALLVALGLQGLGASRRGLALAVLLLVGLVLDYFPARPVGVSVLPDNRVYHLLRGSPELAPVLYLPIWPGESSWSSVHQYATTVTRAPMVNGYAPAVSAEYVRSVARPLEPVNWGELDNPRWALLRRLGVRTIILDREAFPPKVSSFPSAYTLRRLEASASLEPLAADSPLIAFRLTDRPPGQARVPGSPHGAYFEAARLPRTTGRVAAEAGRAIAVAEPGRDRSGFLTYGPYRPFPRGRFRAVFRIQATGGGRGEPDRVEVVAEQGTRLLAARPLRAGSDGFRDERVEFDVAEPDFLEFRTHWAGTSRLAVESVYVTFADQRDPQRHFEMEELMHSLEEHADPTAGNGRASRVDPRWTPRDELLTGPFRRYPAGAWVASLRFRVEGPGGSGPVARFAVVAAGSREPLGESLITVEPLEEGYREVEVPFRLTAPTVLELSLRYLGGAGLLLDRISLRRAG